MSPDRQRRNVMRTLFTIAILLGLAASAAAQTADRLYVMDCGHNSAKDQSRWSPGVNAGKPVDTPVGHATRAKKLISQLGELNLKPSDITFVAVSHTHGDHVGNVDLFPAA